MKSFSEQILMSAKTRMVAVRSPVPTHLAASDVAVTTDIDCWMMDYSVKVSRYVSEDFYFIWLLQLSVVIQFLKLHWMVWWSVTDRQWVGLAGSPVTRATLWEAQRIGPVSPPSSGGNLLPYVTLQCALTSLLLTMDLCCSHVPERRAICVVLCVPMATA